MEFDMDLFDNFDQKEQFQKRTSSDVSSEDLSKQQLQKQVAKAGSYTQFQNDSSVSTENFDEEEGSEKQSSPISSTSNHQKILSGGEDQILEQYKIVLVRHGTSIFNEKSDEYDSQNPWKFKDGRAREFNMNRDLIDTPLSKKGRDQAEEHSKKIDNLSDVHTVFVSPLKRTLETCFYMFQNHPNRGQIKFIVFPYVCEVISKICDISEFDCESLSEEYPWFDFTHLKKIQCGENPESWQLAMIQDSETCTQLRADLGKKFKVQGYAFRDVLVERLEQVFPKPIESYESVFQRGQLAKKYIRQYIQQHNINTNEQKLMVISHNAFLRNFTSQVPDNGKLGPDSTLKGKTLKNCEIISHLI